MLTNCTTSLYDAGDGVEYNIIDKSTNDICSEMSEEFFGFLGKMCSKIGFRFSPKLAPFLCGVNRNFLRKCTIEDPTFSELA